MIKETGRKNRLAEQHECNSFLFRWRCRPLRGLNRFGCFAPGACAPGFMLSRAPRAFSVSHLYSYPRKASPWA